MLFNSVAFLLFFPAVTLCYFLLPVKIRWVWLLIASYYFYMCWEPVYALLMLASTALTYVSGLMIEAATPKNTEDELTAKQRRSRKLAVAFSFITNLGILFFFKYFDFMADNLCAALRIVGIHLNRPSFSVLLPVGISFYTFQALSYTMDVYRGKTPVEHNFFRYALFVSFFPQLVAGPIERSDNLLRQVNQPTRANYDRIRKGLMLMLWGLFQKVVIADQCALIVDTVYNEYAQFAGFTIAFATVMFAIQIYCDFGGYSAIAIGAAQALGFELRPNFRQPYFATSVADFWRRWHISLSTWFRDYLYIPLGGSRCAKWRHYLNLMITFMVSGLWHGASWNYVLWGGLNGGMQVVGDIRRRVTEKLKPKLPEALKPAEPAKQTLSSRILRSGFTFVLICCTWVFFRAPSAREGFKIFAQTFKSFNYWVLVDGTLLRLGVVKEQFPWLMAAIGVLFCVDLLHEKGYCLRDALLRQQVWFRFLIYLLGIFSIAVLGYYGPFVDSSAFIYFQF